MANKYQTVSCHFYDELEALAVKKVLSNITYLENENERLSILNNGYEKCINEDYSYDNMVKKILGKI